MSDQTIVTTGSSTTTITVTPCDPTSPVPCDWQEMHHYDDEGRHWCPTGFVFCHTHFGVGTITGPGACQLWGEVAGDGQP